MVSHSLTCAFGPKLDFSLFTLTCLCIVYFFKRFFLLTNCSVSDSPVFVAVRFLKFSMLSEY